MLATPPGYRARWNTLKEWHDFTSDVIHDWEQVPQCDKDDLVAHTKWSKLWYIYATGGQVRFLQNAESEIPSVTATFVGTKTLPMAHQTPHCQAILILKFKEFYQFHLASAPDCIMASDGVCPSAVILVKLPWQVTPEQAVNELLDAAADPGTTGFCNVN